MKAFTHLRKFWIAALAIVSVTAVVIMGKIDGQAYVAILSSTVAMFKMANQSEKR